MNRESLRIGLLISALAACAPTDPGIDGGALPSDVAASDGTVAPDTARDASTSDAGPRDCTSRLPTSMARVSRGAPVFSSDGEASLANDTDPASAWAPTALPAWIAYDLSGAPVAQRGQVLIAIASPQAADYINDPTDPGFADRRLAVDYTIEVNTATTSDVPTTGWTEVLRVTDNHLSPRQHLVDLGGAPWVRLTLTGEPVGETPRIDFDVYSAPDCASDAWLFMGDSITFIAFVYAFNDVPRLVNEQDPTRWPALIDAARGGTNTHTALETIDETMADFPGRFVVLAYGTNDHAADFMMEDLIQRVIDSGRIPVVPRMIWSYESAEGEAINAQIEALYVAHPEVLRGPDLWAAFEGRTDVLPPGEVHPQGEGNDILRQTWADWMVAITR